MSYEKQKWVPYDETLSEEENIKRGGVVSAEKLNHIEEGIQSASGSLSKKESEELLISFLSGTPIELRIVSDFKNKVPSSDIVNPNMFSRNFSATTLPPTSVWYENSQSAYTSITTLDNQVYAISASNNGLMPLLLVSWNILEIVTRKYPELKGITINELKSIFKGFTSEFWAKGSSPSRNRVIYGLWSPNGNAWSTWADYNGTDIGKTVIASNNQAILTADGFIHVLVYADPSNGATASSVSLDYANIEVTLNVSVNAIKNITTTDELRKMLRGGSIEENTISDFKKKISGSSVDNPNIFKGVAYHTLQPPNGIFGEHSQGFLDLIKQLDGSSTNLSTMTSGYYQQHLISWNILEIVARKFPELKGITVDDLKKIVKILFPKLWVKGSSPKGNKVIANAWGWGAWQGGESYVNQTAEIKLIEYQKLTSVSNYIDSAGSLHMIVYADSSNGTIASSVSIDYASIEITLDLSLANIYIPRTEFNKLEKRVTNLETAIVALGGTI